MTFQSRSAWTSRPNRAVATKRRQQHLTWHYPGFGTDSIKTASWSHDRCLRQIDTWERQHQARGSKNIEYNWFACSHGYLIEGRGNRQNGANGTSAANRAGQSCQVLIGDNERLTAGHRSAMRECVAKVEGYHKGSTSTQYGHRHWVGTRCPGPYVMAEIPVRAGLPGISGGGATVPRPSVPASTPSSPEFADVDKTQAWLRDLGYDPGPIDGKYGTRTGAATRQAQQDLDITPADGKPGPATRTILEDAVSTIDEIKAIVTQNQREIRETNSRVGPIHRDGKDVSLRQEVADGKTLMLALRGELAGLENALRSIGAGEPLDLDQIRAAARDGVSQAISNLEVTVTKGD